MARQTIVLTRSDIDGRVDFDEVIAAIEGCMAAHEDGRDLLPPKLIMELPGGIAACLAGYAAKQHALSMKNGQERQGNRERGLPSIHVHVHLFDPDTGELLMIAEGLLPTVMRTAAAAAVAAKHLAREDARVATVIGAGQLGRQAALAIQRVRQLDRLYICDSHAPSQAALVSSLRGVPALAATPDEAVPQSDIVVTCTNSTSPIVQADWVRPGTHLSCMGADLHPKIECVPALLKRCRLYADNLDQCTSRGEVSQAIEAGVLMPQPFVGRLGQLLRGDVPGRLGEHDITLYDGTGIGVQDTVMAAVLYDLASAAGLGLRIDWTA